ncbi:MAG: hypothetical protein EOL86_15330 [Deltaproteobacteria bacterium]|nr:hypothetical protein [Deltaproteobacteria bacterium]
MKTLNDDQILAGIRACNPKVLNHVYSVYFNSIKQLVCFNHGTTDEARDVFQDALLVIFKRTNDPSFFLSCSFKTFLFAIAQNLWLRKLHQKKKFVSLDNEVSDSSFLFCLECLEFEITIQEERLLMYHRHFDTLTQQCKEIIKMMLEKYSTEEIMKIMDFSSIAYARKRKYQCKQSLFRRIQSDPDYPRLKSNNDEPETLQPD